MPWIVKVDTETNPMVHITLIEFRGLTLQKMIYIIGSCGFPRNNSFNEHG